MKRLSQSLLAVAICSATALLAGCDDNDDNTTTGTTAPVATTETVKGTAATGKAFVGKVEVINSKGEKSSAVTIKADGTFEVTVPKGAPYLIKASNKDTGGGMDAPLIDLYSYLADASKAVNITQLTTQAVYDANGQTNLENLYKDWATSYTRLTQDKLLAAAKRVVANLDTVLAAKFTQAGVDAKTTNVFTIPFTAAHGTTAGTGLDKVLDGVTISGFNNCTAGACSVTYTINDATYSWKYDISTTGYNITFNGGGTGPVIPGGSYNLKVTTNSSALGVQLPPIVVNIPGVPKPTNQSEFCSSEQIKQQLPSGFGTFDCSFSGATGTITTTASVSGISTSFSLKYEYTAS